MSAHDLDKTSGSTSRVYTDRNPLTGMQQEDVTERRNLNWLRAVDSAADDVMWDVPGGRIDALTQNLAGGARQLTAHVQDAGRKLVIVTVVGRNKPQLASVFDSIDLFGDRVDHVIIKNGFWGTPADFDIFDGRVLEDGTRRFGTVAEAAKAVNATVIYVPALLPATAAALDYEDVSPQHAEAVPSQLTGLFDPPEIVRMHIFNVRYWLDEIARACQQTILDPTGNIPSRSLTSDSGEAHDGLSLTAATDRPSNSRRDVG